MPTEELIRDARSGVLRPVKPGDVTRARFNHGYHRGVEAWSSKDLRRDGVTVDTIEAEYYDPVLAKGFVLGWHDAMSGKYGNNSNEAWNRAKQDMAELMLDYVPYRMRP